MKVVWISHGSTLEGAERCLVDAVKALVAEGVEVHVILPSEGRLISLLKDTNVSVYIVPQPRWVKEFRDTSNIIKRLYQYLESTIKLVFILNKLKGDITITNTIVIPCGAIASKLLSIPHVWYIHEFLEEDHGWSFEFSRKFSLKYINLFSSRVIVNSQAVEDRFTEDIPVSKTRLVYYSVEMPKDDGEVAKLNSEKSDFNIVLVGRKSPGKGQEEAIKAVSKLVEKGINIHLSLIGGDFNGYTEVLKECAENLGISDKISFIPFVKNPSLYVKASDAVLMCSRCEAFGRVTIEAMKLGKVVIGANKGSTPELINNGWNGLLYQSGCSDSLASQIELLYKDKVLREKLSVNAYTWSHQKFNSKSYASNLLNVFNEAMS